MISTISSMFSMESATVILSGNAILKYIIYLDMLMLLAYSGLMFVGTGISLIARGTRNARLPEEEREPGAAKGIIMLFVYIILMALSVAIVYIAHSVS